MNREEETMKGSVVGKDNTGKGTVSLESCFLFFFKC